ncbi:DUF4352 domain-containing protein [Pontibacillus salicampi]|uniref:DUF4352 domain-containing protein n=1 Tax=Pontibacillus salicampi TaxID=1449801 RepID=A0ABV6LUD0_9BACI
MMRKSLTFILTILLLLTVAACSGEQSDENNSDTSSNGESGQESSQQNEKDESTDNEQNKETLSIGDSGTFDTTIGKYKFTLDEVSFEKNVEGEESMAGVFVVTGVTIENKGDEPFTVNDVTSSLYVMNPETSTRDIPLAIGEMPKFEGEISPGESVEGKLFFDMEEDGDAYELQMNYVTKEGASGEAVWKFTTDEAAN